MRFPAAIAAIGLVGSVGVGAALGPSSGATVRPHHDWGGGHGLVFTSTNAASGNTVDVFASSDNGSLSPVGSFPTGGDGTGVSVASQGAVTLSPGDTTLLVVNAGSNQISDFAVGSGGQLTLVSVEPSGGTDPISVAISGHLVEVLNAGGKANVSGFEWTPVGLIADPALDQPLSSGAASPEEVSFSPNGQYLVVSEKVSNTFDTFAVEPGPALSSAVTSASNATNPYGFAFAPDGQLIVSNAVGAAAGLASVSRYEIAQGGTLVSTEAPLPDAQTGACWVVVSAHGDVYVSNAHSDTIGSYGVLPDGYLAFFGDTAFGTAGSSGPLDEALDAAGRTLYVLDGGLGRIQAFATGPDVSLSAIGAFGALPTTSVGLAAG
jgi:6-phosphogluconolactonase (cycloisomerase 2 family)